jgi:Na+/H+-dicarboxylate symporter
MTLSRKIVIGLTAGIACGLFFGELCSWLRIVGEAYVALMQMTVLPYIVLALVVNIGSLTVDTARHLAVRAAIVLLALWGVALFVIFALSLGLPEWPTGGFFSSSSIHTEASVDFISLYIPANPFRSLADNLVPAVVTFCICLGVALIGISRKAGIIEPMQVLLDAMTKVTVAVTRVTPYGVFAIAAHAAGTITLDQIERLQGYMIIYIAAAILLSFVVLPVAVAAFTPFTYREILQASRGPLLTAFAADNYFIVLPMLIANLKELYERHDMGGDDVDQAIEISLPIGFPFPNVGRLLALLFIPFGAWYIGRPLELGDYPALVVVGLPSLVAKVTIAIPFLLDFMRLPADLFHLFILTGIVNGHLSSLSGAMHLFAFTAVTAAAVAGRLRFHRKYALVAIAATVGLLLACVGSTRTYLSWVLGRSADTGKIVARMQPIGDTTEATILGEAAPNPAPVDESGSILARIRERGAVRVGYITDNLPFSFENAAGELVGFDVEMAHQLALDLGVGIEFVPIDRPEDIEAHLNADHCDLVMSGISATAAHYLSYPFSKSYIDLTPGLAVPDFKRTTLDTVNELLEAEGLRLGIINDPHLNRIVSKNLPEAELVEVPSAAAFFEAEDPVADVLIISAEAGSAWTLLHPDYHVVAPFKREVRWPLGYPVARGDDEFLRFIDRWIDLKVYGGVIDKLYDHWILGRSAVPKAPRWSVIRNVLHWVD